MTTFVFPIKGATCRNCKGNILYLLNVETQPEYFRFKTIDLSGNLKNLVVEVEDDDPPVSEEEVRRYISTTLEDDNSIYRLVPAEATYHWVCGAVGLIFGVIVLILGLSNGLVWLPIQLLVAAISLGLSCVLGAESLQKARIEWQRGSPGMDSLFLLSTGTAIVISLLGLFIPGLPLMFETSLLIFGFRHIGIALKKSIYSSENFTARYQRLLSNPQTSSGEQNDALLPGTVLTVKAGQMIPIDGWLWSSEASPPEPIYPMNVQRIKGTYLSEALRVGDPVMAGMVAQTDCRIQIGLGHRLRYFSSKPKNHCSRGEIWIYCEANKIKMICRSDRDEGNDPFEVELSPSELTDGSGHCYFNDCLHALELDTVLTQLSKPALNKLSLAVVQRAPACHLTQTSSFLERLEKELEAAASRAAPIQDSANQILKYFVPAVVGLALISGAIALYWFSPIIAIQSMISILVSACPCTLGFVTPLVMEFARSKGAQEGVFFTQSDALQRLSEVNVVLLDIHGTATQGRPVAKVEIENQHRGNEIKTYLAQLEQHSTHHAGKAIYAAVQGNDLLSSVSRLKPIDIQQHPGGISAIIEGKRYLLGNYNLVQPWITMAAPLPHQIYLLEETELGYQRLATINLSDPLRDDTPYTIQQLKQRGLEVYLFTGTDEATAAQYRQLLPGLDGVYAGLGDAKAKRKKLDEIRKADPSKRVLVIGDGANDGAAMTAADASIFIKHSLSDEGAQYQAKAKVLDGLFPVVKALDIAQQAMWRINFNLGLSLFYNLAVVIVSNCLLLTLGVVVHPGICAALMVIQVGLIILSSYQFKHQPLTTQSVASQGTLFGGRSPRDPAANQPWSLPTSLASS